MDGAMKPTKTENEAKTEGRPIGDVLVELGFDEAPDDVYRQERGVTTSFFRLGHLAKRAKKPAAE